MSSSRPCLWTCPDRIGAIFASWACPARQRSGAAGGIVSSFRRICIAALTAAMVVLVVGAAAAQSATEQAGKAYLAGLRPPHQHSKGAQVKTTRLESPHKPTAKSTQQAAKPTVTAKSKTHHRPVRLADKINSRVAWPSVEPSAADQPATPESVLQFATEDATPTSATSAPAASGPATPARATSAAAAAPRVTMPAPVTSAPQTAAPVNIATGDERDSADPIAADKSQTTTTVVPTDRFEAPAPRQMRVIAPALSEAPGVPSAPSDQSPARSGSSMAQMLATLAGAIAACIAAFLIFAFGSTRIRQI
jgi:hypothetical protein